MDPRRPRHAKLTPEEAEERLIPYQDTLPLAPISFTSYNKQVGSASGVWASSCFMCTPDVCDVGRAVQSSSFCCPDDPESCRCWA